MPGQALAIHDVAPVIHPHCVKHALCNIDPEDIHLVLHGTRLLWLYAFTDRELIVAHRSRSAQGRVHFITTLGPVTADARRHDVRETRGLGWGFLGPGPTARGM